jgi:hypothetical protein
MNWSATSSTCAEVPVGVGPPPAAALRRYGAGCFTVAVNPTGSAVRPGRGRRAFSRKLATLVSVVLNVLPADKSPRPGSHAVHRVAHGGNPDPKIVTLTNAPPRPPPTSSNLTTMAQLDHAHTGVRLVSDRPARTSFSRTSPALVPEFGAPSRCDLGTALFALSTWRWCGPVARRLAKRTHPALAAPFETVPCSRRRKAALSVLAPVAERPGEMAVVNAAEIRSRRPGCDQFNGIRRWP